MTFLELINRVLVRLRMPEAASASSGYQALVGALVNDAKRDVEDAGPWYALRTTINKTLTASTSFVSLVNETNDRSYLLYTMNLPLAFVTTTDEERRLDVVEKGELDAIRALDPDAQEDVPYAVAFTRANDGLVAEFFPIPDAAYTVRFIMVVPQEDLEDTDDELSVPAAPVWTQALAFAAEERGEEMGTTVARLQERADQAMNDAMQADFLQDDMTFRAD